MPLPTQSSSQRPARCAARPTRSRSLSPRPTRTCGGCARRWSTRTWPTTSHRRPSCARPPRFTASAAARADARGARDRPPRVHGRAARSSSPSTPRRSPRGEPRSPPTPDLSGEVATARAPGATGPRPAQRVRAHAALPALLRGGCGGLRLPHGDDPLARRARARRPDRARAGRSDRSASGPRDPARAPARSGARRERVGGVRRDVRPDPRARSRRESSAGWHPVHRATDARRRRR